MKETSRRSTLWRAYGASEVETDELLSYARSAFDSSVFEGRIECPLPDEPFVQAWEGYAAEGARAGVAACLRARLVQLRFPIAAGMSTNAAYLAAVRRGVETRDRDDPGLQFAGADSLRLFIHPTAAGRVPVVVAGAREDFVSLVQALTCRNEPAPISASMGACIVAGYNNWDRVFQLRSQWESSAPSDSDAAWSVVFSRIVPRKELYQDRFIVLSSGPYSGVTAEEMGVPSSEWERLSLVIRLEHECAHYFTRHALGAMRNSILDELVADFAGIVAAIGYYRADWFLRFLGLDSDGSCRPGGRIHNYRGSPPLSDGAFSVVQVVVRRAAEHLERFDRDRESRPRGAIETARVIVALARIGLEAIACDDAAALLREALASARDVVRPAISQRAVAAPEP